MAGKKETASPWHAVSIERGGRTYQGRYRLEANDLMRVEYNFHEKCAQLKEVVPAALAQVVLGELVHEHPV